MSSNKHNAGIRTRKALTEGTWTILRLHAGARFCPFPVAKRSFPWHGAGQCRCAARYTPDSFSLTAMSRNLLVGILLAAPFRSSVAQAPKTYDVGRIETRLGEILFVLYDQTPHHKASFIKLATTHYWDSLTFNRVIKNFVAQGGCPDTPKGFSGSPYLVAPEFNDSLKHVYGAVGAGRDDNPGQLSAGCQFYIVANRQGLPKLDNHYTVYGKVIKGMDVVEAIVSVPTDSTNQPLVPITLHVDVITMTADQLRGYGYVVSHVKN